MTEWLLEGRQDQYIPVNPNGSVSNTIAIAKQQYT
jgi:hypothetical protein